MAKSIIEKFQYTGGYTDVILGPYDSLASLKDISLDDRFEGLTAVVMAPVQMECWLVGGTSNSSWRIKDLSPLATYADLVSATTIIQSQFVRMINVGTEATVLEDETNDGQLTKYWASAVNTTAKTVTWEKMIKGSDLTPYAKKAWVEENFVGKDCVSGEDIE